VSPRCPVCRDSGTRPFQEIEPHRYWRCQQCQATFVDPDQLPDPATEKAEYDRHQNDPQDAGYRRFLSRLADPLLERLTPGSAGLDYGCGPGPALAAMLGEAGHHMTIFDPIYQPDPEPLQRQYDFISCTEVVEHFHHPASEFERLHNLLRPGGWLGIMTLFQTDDQRFAHWHYRRDPTHVVFYREETFHWLARHWQWQVETKAPGIILAQKLTD
jgi:SAM-dependent methyltransferase